MGRGNTIAQGVRGLVIGDGQTLNEDGIITPRINGALIQSTNYAANLTQTGTNAPTALELSNNFGDITWTRVSAGQYLGSPITKFEPTNTYIVINQTNRKAYITAYITTDGNIVVNTLEIGFETTGEKGYILKDGYLNNTTIEIRTY
jgi:hypothetical protein